MAIKKIITLENDPDGILSCLTLPVGPPGHPMAARMEYNEETLQLFQDMKDTAASIGCLGLAANQIGEPWAVFLVMEEYGPSIMVNPEYVVKTGRVYSFNEGCLSVGERRDVRRFKKVIIAGRDEDGNYKRVARTKKPYVFAYQHEMDHLMGKTILDY